MLAFIIVSCSTLRRAGDDASSAASKGAKLATAIRTDSLAEEVAVRQQAVEERKQVASLDRVEAIEVRDSADVKAEPEALDSMKNSGLGDSLSLTDSLSVPDSIPHRSTLADSLLADTARYLIHNGDTVYLGRGGHTGPDTLAIDSSKQSKSALDAPVDFTAQDSIVFDYQVNRVNFYGSANVKYTNLELTADLITMSVDSSIVHALGTKDSLGTVTSPPVCV